MLTSKRVGYNNPHQTMLLVTSYNNDKRKERIRICALPSSSDLIYQCVVVVKMLVVVVVK